MSKNHSDYTSSNGNEYQIDGGYYTGYSASNEEGNSVQGFDTPEEVREYIEGKEDGSDNTIDTISFNKE